MKLKKKKIIRDTTRKYRLMFKQHKDGLSGTCINCYTCDTCGHVTKTIHIDKGVTPKKYPCEKCRKLATNSNYKDIAPDQAPTIEWYRPTLTEVLEHWVRNESLLEYILNGGLLDRKRIVEGEQPCSNVL